MKSERNQRIYKTIMLVLLTAVITFIVTTSVIYNNIGNSNTKYMLSNKTSLGNKFDYYKSFIEKHYIGEIDDEKMLESAIKGYFEGLGDPYSEFITKEEMQEYMADATGKYVGIGIYITSSTEKNQLLILAPMKGSPAEEAGLKSGDVILKIDGKEYTGEELTEATNVLKAEEGTKVKLEILRDEKTFEVEVERRTIKVSHIESSIKENNIGYMQISTFDEGCYKEFLENYNTLKESNIKGLIIDLRNNGGGIVDESIDIADMFTNKDDILLITIGKTGTKEDVTKAKQAKTINIPVVILVNENTASASEILTAAIKENNEDTVYIVGKNTYGKGIIQSIFTLNDGSGIKLTTNEYYTPKHNSIHKVGIKPDYEVDVPEGENAYTMTEENDAQLKKALEILK